MRGHIVEMYARIFAWWMCLVCGHRIRLAKEEKSVICPACKKGRMKMEGSA